MSLEASKQTVDLLFESIAGLAAAVAAGVSSESMLSKLDDPDDAVDEDLGINVDLVAVEEAAVAAAEEVVDGRFHCVSSRLAL